MSGRLLGLGAALTLIGSALADTTTVSNSIPLTDTDYSKTIALKQFDPSQGHLDSIDITFNGSVVSTIKIENTDPVLINYTATPSYNLNLSSAAGTPLVSLMPYVKPIAGQLQAFDSVADFQGVSAVTIANVNTSATGTKTLTSAADLAAFTGSGTVNLPVNAFASEVITGSANALDLILTQASAGVIVTYRYTPYALASLGDRVFFDANNNGIQDATEKGVANAPVALLDANGNVLKTTKTDPSGLYLFQGLQPGDYRVQFGKPDGYAYAFAKQDVGDDNFDSDATPTGLTGLVHLDSGQNRRDVDAGLVGTLCVGDRVWKDYNGDGFQNCDEPGFPGVAVHLLDSSGNVLADTVTDSCGLYKFCNVAAGDYTIDFDAPSGYGFTKQFAKYNNVGYPVYDSNADTTTGYATVSLTSNDMTIDAGLVGGLKIGDQVWLDSDGDGKFDVDQGEKGIKGVRVTLYGYLNNDWVPDVVLSTTTDASGKYLFNGLFPGTYVVATNPYDLKGLTPTYDLDGTVSAYYAVGKLSNADRLDFDFGFKPSSFCGCASHCWWQCNPDCWPTSCVWIGGQCHTKSQMCGWMKIGNCADKSICLYQRLCAAKLNVASGCDHGKVYTCGKTTCSVKDAIRCVDAWMAKHPVGCNVSGSSADWASISDCYSILDKYCSGN